MDLILYVVYVVVVSFLLGRFMVEFTRDTAFIEGYPTGEDEAFLSVIALAILGNVLLVALVWRVTDSFYYYVPGAIVYAVSVVYYIPRIWRPRRVM